MQRCNITIFFPLSSLWHCLLPVILFPTLCACATHKQNVWIPLYLEINMTHPCIFSLVKTCVVGYSIHDIPCSSLTPTAIDYRESNISVTMQQPSSVVHNMLKYTQSLNTQRKHRKKQVRMFSSMFWQEIATFMHFRCQGWHVQSAGHTLGRGFHALKSEGGADS